MIRLVEIIYSGAVGISIIRSIAPDIDEIIVFGEEQHVCDRIVVS